MVRGAIDRSPTSRYTLVRLGTEKTNLVVQQLSNDMGEVKRDVEEVKCL